MGRSHAINRERNEDIVQQATWPSSVGAWLGNAVKPPGALDR
jgi:hypothetical protein